MTPRSEAPRSRRERPAKPALTYEGIVAAAVGIMRAEGLPKLTMRRLAQELDTGPASLYVYVRNTAELHAAILDEMLAAVAPPPADGQWDERLEALFTSYALVLLDHPGLARSALLSWPSGPRYLRLLDTALGLLADGGVPAGQAAWGADLLFQYATATAAEHASGERTTSDASQEWDALGRAVHGASASEYPHIAALGPRLLSGAPRERMSWGLRTLINGIRHAAAPGTPAALPAAADDDTPAPAG